MDCYACEYDDEKTFRTKRPLHVLGSNTKKAVLTDFGLARILTGQVLVVHAFNVTELKGISGRYAAPEYIISLKNRVKADNGTVLSWDVYLFGIILYDSINWKSVSMQNSFTKHSN